MKTLNKWIRMALRKRGYDLTRHVELADWLELHQIDVVLDIGANDGRYAKEIRESGWHGRIVSFEPQPDVFRRLSDRMKHDTGWTGMQIGLGSKDTTLSMNTYGKDVLSSFLRKSDNDPTSRLIEVSVRRPDTILDEILQGAKRPFVKIDTQGYELEIIKGFGNRASEIAGWQLELSIEPLYENQPAIEQVIGMMRALGFSLWKILPGLRDPKTLQAFELDGIFFKSA